MAEPACFAGIVAALDFEAAAFKGKLSSSLRLEVCGMGADAAGEAARRLLEQGAGLLISFGTAGALGDAGAGEIVVPDRVVDGPGICRETDAELTRILCRHLPASVAIRHGLLFSAGQPVTSPMEKRTLHGTTGAEAVDLESAAIAGAAAGRVPFLALRVIVDVAEQTIPQAALQAVDGTVSRPLTMLPALVKSPRQIPALLSLGLASRRAARSLSHCADALSAAMSDEGFLNAIAGHSAP